jgi:hypothetical protein
VADVVKVLALYFHDSFTHSKAAITEPNRAAEKPFICYIVKFLGGLILFEETPSEKNKWTLIFEFIQVLIIITGNRC